MKSAGRKLFVSVFVLVVALSLTVTSTFAWFTMSATPKVSEFNVNVTTSDGLLISATGAAGSFKATLSSADIASANADLAELELTAVTSEDGKAFKNLGGTAADAGSYFDFTLYFISNTKQSVKLLQGANTYLTSSGGTGLNLVKAWKNISENEYGTHSAIALGSDITALSQNAARMSFKNINKDTTETLKVWYPHSDIGFNKDTDPTTPKNLAMDYYNYLYDPDIGTPAPTLASTINNDGIYSETLLTLDADAVNGGYSGSLTISVWIEGWDGDCFNSIFADNLKIALQFTGSTAA